MEHETVRELTAAYALDALDPKDERAFEEHLSRCAECRDELASLQAAAAHLAYDVDAPVPPPALLDRILEQAREERPKVVPLRARWALPAAAAVAAIAACAAIGLGIWAASLSGKVGDERAASSEQARVVALLASENARRIPLEGAQGTLVVGPNGDAVLVVSRLAPAPDEKTYEAWVIEGNVAKPAGIFEARHGTTAFPLDRPVRKGAVVAVTLEPEGGVDQPTSEPLFASPAT